MTKLTIQQVRDIKFGNASVKTLMRNHKIGAAAIYLIRKGERWGHIEPVRAKNE